MNKRFLNYFLFILCICFGVLFLTQKTFVLFLFLIFVALNARYKNSNTFNAAKFLYYFIGTGFFLELLAWTGNWVQQSENPALLHPQLIPDLILGIFFYASLACGFLVASRKYSFTVREVFAAFGIFGVLIEQKGLIFFQGLQTMPAGLFLWLFVFLVYGSLGGIAFLFAGNSLSSVRQSLFVKYLLLFLSLFFFSTIIGLITTPILSQVLPQRGSIVERPLW